MTSVILKSSSIELKQEWRRRADQHLWRFWKKWSFWPPNVQENDSVDVSEENSICWREQCKRTNKKCEDREIFRQRGFPDWIEWRFYYNYNYIISIQNQFMCMSSVFPILTLLTDSFKKPIPVHIISMENTQEHHEQKLQCHIQKTFDNRFAHKCLGKLWYWNQPPWPKIKNYTLTILSSLNMWYMWVFPKILVPQNGWWK